MSKSKKKLSHASNSPAQPKSRRASKSEVPALARFADEMLTSGVARRLVTSESFPRRFNVDIDAASVDLGRMAMMSKGDEASIILRCVRRGANKIQFKLASITLL